MAHANPDPQETLAERVRQLEEQLDALRRQQAQQPRAMLQRLVPSEVRGHLRAARREQLLALRAWVDAAIGRTEDTPERPRRPESLHID